MNIFITPQSPRANSNEALIKLISRTQNERKKNLRLIVIDDAYKLSNPPHDKKPATITKLYLKNFLCSTRSSAHICPSRIMQLINETNSPWIVVDSDQSDQTTCSDFAYKLSHYGFLSRLSRDKNILLTTPAINLDAIAQAINETLTKVPISTYSNAQPGHIGILFLSETVENYARPWWTRYCSK